MTGTKDGAEHVNQTLDMTRVGKSIRRLHDLVCSHKQRVEITRAGCDDVCVMISKKELESLERALQIFADTEEFAKMSETLRRIVEMASQENLVASAEVLGGLEEYTAAVRQTHAGH